jgi:putative hemolysin
VSGDVSLADLQDYGIDLGAGTDTYVSVGGLVLDAVGRLPDPGERLTINRFSLTIESVHDNRIELIRVARRQAD